MGKNTLRPFRRAEGKDLEERVRLLQDNLEQCLKFVAECPIIAGVLLGPFTLVAATSQTIEHRLGRVPRGIAVLNKSNTISVSITNITATTFTIMCTLANCTVSCWVF